MKRIFMVFITSIALFAFSIGASAQTTSGDLTSSKAMKLALSAREHFWSVMGGHNVKAENYFCSSRSFQNKGQYYRYFCSEFDTKTKLVNYMNEVFTLNAIDKAFKKYHFIVYKGKMAQPDADGGSLADWKNAKAKLIYQRKDVRLYQFTVPVPIDNKIVETFKQNVTFVKVRGKWQINDFDAVR
ncbi:IseA DL-endopeptidase inhibitor family protein [Margalitia sp. FSL K6-0131]|uniref:IseA DL-endopeptidase inhibitor family protein n=1 Tax=Margalitia sp. FSL K6-0131 TaxID=2954604 RepID=UPI0030F5C4AA